MAMISEKLDIYIKIVLLLFLVLHSSLIFSECQHWEWEGAWTYWSSARYCAGHVTSYILSIFMITSRARYFYYHFTDIKTDSEILSDLL